MKYLTKIHENYVLLQLQEEKLNSTIAPDLKSILLMLGTQGMPNFLLDLSEVKYADSSGLSALLRGKAIASEAGGLFVIFGVTEHVEKLIKITHLDRVFNMVPTQQEAIEAVFMHEIEKEVTEEEEEGEE